jgi:hypothetical protein
VLPIIIPPDAKGDVNISSIYADIADAASLRLGLHIISNEEMFVASSSNLSSRVQDCGPDVSCIAQRLRAFDAPLGMVVTVDRTADPPLIALQLLDTDESRLMGKSVGDLDKSEGNISAALRKRARKLFEQTGFTQAGRVVVDVNPANAKISISSGVEPDQGTPNVFTVAPGSYNIRAELDGYLASAGDVVALGGQEARLALVLERNASITESVWFWSAIGAAVVGGGAAAVVLATRPNGRCVCLVYKGMGCACPE